MSVCPICSAELPPPAIRSPDRGQGTPGEFAVAICPGCGAGITLPPASAEELAAFYPQGYGAHSGVETAVLRRVSRAIRWLQSRRELRRAPLSAIAAERPGRGLDVGAGRGDVAAALASRGWRMTAIEPAGGAVAQMRRRGLDAREGVLGTIALEPGEYDFALFQHSLEHTLDPVADLRAVRDALAPGGLVLISVPNFGSWQRRLFGTAWYQLDLPRHRTHFTEGALARALARAGFGDARFARSSSAVGLPASVQYRLAGRCLFRAGLKLRVAAGLCVLAVPLTWALDQLAGEADTLHAVARRPA